jgi:glucose/arabinose dehydrogenase
MKSVCVLLLFIIFGTVPVSGQEVSLYEVLPQDLDRPLGVEFSHEGSSMVYILSRTGYIERFDKNDPEATFERWFELPQDVFLLSEGGLLGLTFHPDFPENNSFFVYFTYDDEGQYKSRLSRFRVNDGVADEESEEIILEFDQPASNHNGGALEFGADGYLYISSGDGGGSGSRENSQDLTNLLGAILRIDINTDEGYLIPPDNPLIDDPDAMDEIFAWGLRHPWRMSFDPVTGHLWVADVGPSSWEMIHIVENGKNYGYPIIVGGECRVEGCDKTGLEMPVYRYEWGLDETGFSITGGYVYRGSANPSLYGKYIYGDFVSGRIWALEVNHDTWEVLSNTELYHTDFNIPSFGIDSDLEIYTIGWGEDRKLYRFQPEETGGEPVPPPAVVVLLSPVDGSVDVSVDPVLSWEEVVQGAGYRVQVSSDSEFGSMAVDVADLSETQYEVSGLAFESTYYWRVRVSNDAGDGVWSEVWSFTTEEEPLSPPGVVALNSPENGVVDVSVNPVLDWQPAEGGAGYRVQVSGDSGFGTVVVDQFEIEQEQYEVSELAYETTYYWRARASNDAGVGAWSAVWSFTTEEEPLSPPGVVSLVSPEDGAVDVSISPVLNWEAVEQGTGYRVQVSGDSGFDTVVVDQSDIDQTQYEVSGLSYESTYYWRVRASNDAGDGVWSEVWSFTTEEEPLSPPGVVTLLSPGDGSVDVSISPVLNWEAVAQGTGYRVQVSGDSDFNTVVVDQSDIDQTQYEVSGLSYETTYYWRVRASNDAGDGGWSAVWSFTTEDEPLSPPGVVMLTSPEDGAADVSVDPVLNWEAVEQGTGYRVQVSGDSDFSTVVVDQSEIEQSQYEVSGLAYETTYYWRVRASNDAGDGVWSAVWSFTTHVEPVIEDLVLTEKEESLELSWDLSVDVDISEFRVYRGSSVSELQLLESLPAGTKQYTDTDLPEGAFVYVVTLLDIFGEENGFSNIVSYYNADVVATKEWTLVSIPVNHEGIEFPGSNLFGFDRVYRSETELKPGRGYWVKSSASDGSSEQVDLRGRGLEQATLAMNNGWNLVGGLIDRVTVSTIGDPLGILTTAPVYSYNEGAYQEVAELEPSEGYWIYAQEEGTIDLEISSEISVLKEEPQLAAMYAEESDRIVFSREGREFTFRVSASALDRDRQFRYLMPPRAPEPVLDVRTAQDFRVSDRSSELLELTSPGYPVKVEFMADEASGHVYRLIAEEEDGTVVHINLMPGQRQFINKEYEKLTLERIHRDEAILETSIAHNYPNPFNPSTTIRYRIAQQSEVVMDVFDVAGRRVARLVNSIQEPGEYFVQFDGSALASGVYFLRLQASSFVDVQKLTLIK